MRGRPSAGAVRDAGPYVYWYRAEEIEAELAAAGFEIAAIGTTPTGGERPDAVVGRGAGHRRAGGHSTLPAASRRRLGSARASNSSSVSSSPAAATSSSRCSIEFVPGIGTIAGERCSSQASEICAAVAPWALATGSHGPEVSATRPAARGYHGMYASPSRSHRSTSASSSRSATL